MVNKRGDSVLMDTIVPVIFVIIFLVIGGLFMLRVGSGDVTSEQIYAKQIALIIDKADVGMKINLDVSKLHDIAEGNDYRGQIINIDNELNVVRVNLVKGKGYEFKFFNGRDIVWELNEEEELVFEVVDGVGIGDGVIEGGVVENE